MRNPADILRENVDAKLKEIGSNQTRLAAQMGKSQPALSKSLSGNNIGLEIVKDIADKLDVDVDWLFTDRSKKIDDKKNISDEKLAIISIVLALDEKDISALALFLRGIAPVDKNKRSTAG
jgi:transcriptional regulator with XRE-family HTH domain